MKDKLSILFAILLFLYGVVAYGQFLHSYEPSMSILVHEHPTTTRKPTSLLKGSILTYEIQPPLNNLGIIAVRFQTQGKINDDIIIFRIKEKGTSSWLYSGNYKTDQFQDHELFPFGFPLIPQSANKSYVFELESYRGTESEHVTIDSIRPVIVSKYYHPANGERPITLANIALGLNKIINLLSNSSFVFPLFIFFSPLVVFIINSSISLAIPLALISAQYFLNLPTPYHWTSSILLAWLTFLLTTKASYRISVVLSLLASFYLVSQSQINDFNGAREASLWLYFCLLVTIIQIKVNSFD